MVQKSATGTDACRLDLLQDGLKNASWQMEQHLHTVCNINFGAIFRDKIASLPCCFIGHRELIVGILLSSSKVPISSSCIPLLQLIMMQRTEGKMRDSPTVAESDFESFRNI